MEIKFCSILVFLIIDLILLWIFLSVLLLCKVWYFIIVMWVLRMFFCIFVRRIELCVVE